MYRMDFVDLAYVYDWAYDAVAWLNMRNIYVIREEYLAPKEKATRAEAAAFLHRYDVYLQNSKP